MGLEVEDSLPHPQPSPLSINKNKECRTQCRTLLNLNNACPWTPCLSCKGYISFSSPAVTLFRPRCEFPAKSSPMHSRNWKREKEKVLHLGSRL